MRTVALGVFFLALAPGASANPIIVANLDSSITDDPNAANIEGAINAAIAAIDGLYSNSVTIPVTFTYNPAPDPVSLSQNSYFLPYSDYVSLLAADSAANPVNAVLASAVANLALGNGGDGQDQMVVTGAQYDMLAGASLPSGATINIDSDDAFAFSQPASNNQFDLVGGLEYELDQVMGGGGAGSTLNSYFAENCNIDPSNSPYCQAFGPTDLYRYLAPGTPSYSTSVFANAYFSVDGGVTGIVAFNQNSAGFYGDFASSCGAGGAQLIQSAFPCLGPFEAYTTSSPEYEMEEAIGWDPTPEPGAFILLAAGLALAASRRTAPRRRLYLFAEYRSEAARSER